MAEVTIPVDLRNPGQVFACLGLMEAAEILFAGREVLGGYAWRGRETRVRFRLAVDGVEEPILEILRFLTTAEAVALAPPGSDLRALEKGVATDQVQQEKVFPCPAPATPAALPVELRGSGVAVPVGHWADGRHIGRDNVKFWAGAGGYSGAALARDALDLIRPLGKTGLTAAAADPFTVRAPQSSSFRFDWRRDYVPLDVGFSPNANGKIEMVGYPLVELLAAIGLEHARPQRLTKLRYRYGAASALLPIVFARAVLGGQDLGFPERIFSMVLGWPGQEGQARCIINAFEEEDNRR